MLLKNLFTLAAFFAAPLLTSAFPTGAGTCDVNAMGGPHVTPGAKVVNGGFKIATAKSGADYTITLNGAKQVKGLLVYVVNAKGDRVGSFNNLSKLVQYKACGGGVNSTITHNSPDLKGPVLKYTWSSGTSNAAQWTVKAIVVQDVKTWYKLDDTTFDLVTGNVVMNNTTNTGNGTTTDSNSNPSNSTSDSTGSGGGGGGYGASSASKSNPALLIGILYAAFATIAMPYIL